MNITHGATYREHPYFVSCLNEQNSDWVNVVYEIAKSGKKLSISFFTKQSTAITNQRMSVKLTMVAVSRSVQTLSSHSTVTVMVLRTRMSTRTTPPFTHVYTRACLWRRPMSTPTIYRGNLRREKNDRLVSVHTSVDYGNVW